MRRRTLLAGFAAFAAAARGQGRRDRTTLPFEQVTVPGRQALAEWERLTTAGRGVPVVVGDDDELVRTAEQLGYGGTDLPSPPAAQARETLREAACLRMPDDLPDWPETSTAAVIAPPATPPKPAAAPDDGLTIATDILKRQPLNRVHILLIPAAASWQVPAWLDWGGWNECPGPETHVAALRDWHRRYGAELVAINHDTMNVRVRRPPTTPEAAVALAREQYAYAPDIVDQGAGSIAELAGTLLNSGWWFFWWD